VNLSLLTIGGSTVRVRGSSIAPYPIPDADADGRRVGDGGGEFTANSHMINPPSGSCLFGMAEREEAYDGESEFDIVTSNKASVVVDKMCKTARSKVRSGQVGRAID
jgi:hypothetical protein